MSEPRHAGELSYWGRTDSLPGMKRWLALVALVFLIVVLVVEFGTYRPPCHHHHYVPLHVEGTRVPLARC
jgi:hypothetical protein